MDNFTSEDFKELKEETKRSKEERKTINTLVLLDKGIRFESKNFGYHLIVEGKQSIIDFWPSTGKFIVRQNRKKGHGIGKLLELC